MNQGSAEYILFVLGAAVLIPVIVSDVVGRVRVALCLLSAALLAPAVVDLYVTALGL